MEELSGDGAEALTMGRVRRWSWVGLPLLGLVFLSAGRSPLPFDASTLIERSAYALPVALTVVLGLVAASRSGDVERRFWRFLALANAALLACEILLVWWLLALDPNGPPRISWPFQSLHLVAVISLAGVLWSMSRLTIAAATTRARYLLDVGALSLLAYAAALTLHVRPLMEPAGAPMSHVLAGAGYPVAGSLMLAGAVANVAGLKLAKWRSWERLVVVSLTVYVVGMLLWPSWYAGAQQTSRTDERGLLDLVQLTGHYLLMMAAVYRVTEGRGLVRRPLPPTTKVRGRLAAAAVPLLALSTAAALTVVALSSEGPWAWAYGGIAAALAVLLGVRGVLQSLEHGVLFHRSLTDPLTGLYNHRFFHDRLAEELEAASAAGEPLSLLLLDVDDFAAVNAREGRAAGERTLAALADRLRTGAGDDAIVARLGGDEFAIVLPATAAPEAEAEAQRLADRVAVASASDPNRLTLSVGVAAFPEHAGGADELFLLAECALTSAKERGKDRVSTFDPDRMPAVTGRERARQLEKQVRLSSIRALAAAVDARDPETRDHSRSVARLAEQFAPIAGLDEERAGLLATAALLHDVGKIGVPDELLRKSRPLTAEEFRRVAQHPVLGQQILSAADLGEILAWVRSHHERWDGSGYPDGLAGEEIPPESRILALCDSFDAMTSDRPYRRAMSEEAALLEIDHCMGSQFDPHLGDLFIRAVCEGRVTAVGETPVPAGGPQTLPLEPSNA